MNSQSIWLSNSESLCFVCDKFLFSDYRLDFNGSYANKDFFVSIFYAAHAWKMNCFDYKFDKWKKWVGDSLKKKPALDCDKAEGIVRQECSDCKTNYLSDPEVYSGQSTLKGE